MGQVTNPENWMREQATSASFVLMEAFLFLLRPRRRRQAGAVPRFPRMAADCKMERLGRPKNTRRIVPREWAECKSKLRITGLQGGHLNGCTAMETPSVRRVAMLGTRNIRREAMSQVDWVEAPLPSWEARRRAEVWLVMESRVWVTGRPARVKPVTTLYLGPVFQRSGEAITPCLIAFY